MPTLKCEGRTGLPTVRPAKLAAVNDDINSA